MIGSRPVAIGSTLVILAAIVAVFFVPGPVRWVAVIIVILLIAANFARVFWVFREERRLGEAIVAAHPGETVFRTGLWAFDDLASTDRARVVAAIVSRSGLSFRDRRDAEVVQLAASRILSVELAPLVPRSPRPAILTLIDGAPVKIWVGATPDQQVERIVAIRTALGRASG